MPPGASAPLVKVPLVPKVSLRDFPFPKTLERVDLGFPPPSQGEISRLVPLSNE
jgi:hypothetical protein